MRIIFYNSRAEKNRVDKSLYITEVITLEGTLKESCSVVTPRITITSSTLINANYVYIPDFNRYYFINNITNISLDVWSVDLTCDVLMSYKDNILSLNLLIERQEYESNPYIIDGEVITDNEPIIDIIEKNIPQFTVQSGGRNARPFALTCVSEV